MMMMSLILVVLCVCVFDRRFWWHVIVCSYWDPCGAGDPQMEQRWKTRSPYGSLHFKMCHSCHLWHWSKTLLASMSSLFNNPILAVMVNTLKAELMGIGEYQEVKYQMKQKMSATFFASRKGNRIFLHAAYIWVTLLCIAVHWSRFCAHSAMKSREPDMDHRCRTKTYALKVYHFLCSGSQMLSQNDFGVSHSASSFSE